MTKETASLLLQLLQNCRVDFSSENARADAEKLFAAAEEARAAIGLAKQQEQFVVTTTR